MQINKTYAHITYFLVFNKVMKIYYTNTIYIYIHAEKESDVEFLPHRN